MGSSKWSQEIYSNKGKSLSKDLPEYPRTLHLPFHPNTQRGDLLAGPESLDLVQNSPTMEITEKIDGSNCGIMLFEDNFIVRNREHILNKGYQKKETPAKLQFRPIWNYAHENKKKFEILNKHFGGPVGVYAEWMWAVHGMKYTKLPDYFIPYEIYDPEQHNFIAPYETRLALEIAGFTVAPILHYGKIELEKLLILSQKICEWAEGPIEGLYFKDACNTPFVQHRFKMVREGFKQGGLWNEKELDRNKVIS